MRNGYDVTFDVSPVVIGSSEFAAIVEIAPEIAAAAALGGLVVTLAAAGTWVELSWPDTAGSEAVVFELPGATADRDPVTAIAIADPPSRAAGRTRTQGTI